MKTVHMLRDFDYRMHPRRSVRFRAGRTYSRVLENAVLQIEQAGAGRMVSPPTAAGTFTVDASHAFRPRKQR